MDYVTVHDAWFGTLRRVVTHGAHVASRGLGCLELRDEVFTVTHPTVEPIHCGLPDRDERVARYTHAEFELFEAGERRASKFAKHAKMWARLSNPDGTINSAYGWLVFHNQSCGKSKFAKHGPLTPWDWARCTLLADHDTRQAFLRFSLPSHQWAGNRDQVCTMHGNFLIRDSRLHLTMVMRSNDVIRGLVYDMPWFVSLQHKMLVELRSRYEYLTLGEYRHIAHSMHVYETDNELVEKILR